jgi:hypothetical protein
MNLLFIILQAAMAAGFFLMIIFIIYFIASLLILNKVIYKIIPKKLNSYLANKKTPRGNVIIIHFLIVLFNFVLSITVFALLIYLFDYCNPDFLKYS